MSGGVGVGPVVAAVLPPVPALLPEHASLTDPLPGLRAACRDAVDDLLAGARRVVVLHDPLVPADRARGVSEPLGARVGRALLAGAGWAGDTDYLPPGDPVPRLNNDGVLLVMASGAARRGERAPGHLDERSFAFDEAVTAALGSGDPAALAALDADLGEELLAAGIRCLRRLGEVLGEQPGGADRPREADVRWAGDPYGVQYWVAVLRRGDPGSH